YPGRGYAGSGCGSHRGGVAVDRSGLQQQQEGVDRFAEIFSVRVGFWKNGASGEREFCRTLSPGRSSKTRCAATVGWIGSRLDRSGSAVREIWSYAGGAHPGFARACARLSRREAGGKGDLDDVVSAVEEDDRVGQCGY